MLILHSPIQYVKTNIDNLTGKICLSLETSMMSGMISIITAHVVASVVGGGAVCVSLSAEYEYVGACLYVCVCVRARARASVSLCQLTVYVSVAVLAILIVMSDHIRNGMALLD